jgi:hypothetical protein
MTVAIALWLGTVVGFLCGAVFTGMACWFIGAPDEYE